MHVKQVSNTHTCGGSIVVCMSNYCFCDSDVFFALFLEPNQKFDRVELTVLGTEGSSLRTKMGELMERHVMAANKIPNGKL